MGTPYVCPDCGNQLFNVGVFVPCECQLSARLAEIAAEEAAGGRKFEFEEREFGSPEIEALYTEFPKPGAAAVQPWLPDEVKRAREMEARGYYLWTPRLLKGYTSPSRGKMAENRALMYHAERPEDVPSATVRAIGCVIEEMEPSWVEVVAEARCLADDPRVVAAWCELPLQAVVAALDVLRRREGDS